MEVTDNYSEQVVVVQQEEKQEETQVAEKGTRRNTRSEFSPFEDMTFKEMVKQVSNYYFVCFGMVL